MPEPPSEPCPYRVTLFFGPEPVEGKPSTHACVFNVKKRSWKGGVQVTVEITDSQIQFDRAAVDFGRWIDAALLETPSEERKSLADRAEELFIQALCRCKLELLLQSGITQETRRLTADTGAADWKETVRRRTGFVTSYVATELDLTPRDTSSF